jgi:adenine-specific DNA-methyltransferase
MIKYLGSKRTLLPLIGRIALSLPEARSVTDLFSGTSRVGHALKQRGLQVFANDVTAFATTLARCYVEADAEDVVVDAERLIAEFNRLPGRPGWFTQTFCERARFFQPKNGARVDAIRDAIAALGLPPVLESVLLVSLMEAADRVDSTCGVQMAFLKKWAARADNDLQLRLPAVLPRSPYGRCRATQADAADAVADLVADIVYLDPPYNHHSYLNNYHIWESLVLWDQPETYGIAQKRVDCRTRKSAFNQKKSAFDAFAAIVRAARGRLLVVSFNDEGWISRAEMEALLAERGPVCVIANDYRRYVGAQIGIFNPQGEKVGKVSHLRNTEYIYIVDVAGSGVDWSALGAA